jgi:hypothetical protein
LRSFHLTWDLQVTVRTHPPGWPAAPDLRLIYKIGGAVLNPTTDLFAYGFISRRGNGKTVFRAKDFGREDAASTGRPPA